MCIYDRLKIIVEKRGFRKLDFCYFSIIVCISFCFIRIHQLPLQFLLREIAVHGAGF
jgi:hypothetical protein